MRFVLSITGLIVGALPPKNAGAQTLQETLNYIVARKSNLSVERDEISAMALSCASTTLDYTARQSANTLQFSLKDLDLDGATSDGSQLIFKILPGRPPVQSSYGKANAGGFRESYKTNTLYLNTDLNETLKANLLRAVLHAARLCGATGSTTQVDPFAGTPSTTRSITPSSPPNGYAARGDINYHLDARSFGWLPPREVEQLDLTEIARAFPRRAVRWILDRASSVDPQTVAIVGSPVTINNCTMRWYSAVAPDPPYLIESDLRQPRWQRAGIKAENLEANLEWFAKKPRPMRSGRFRIHAADSFEFFDFDTLEDAFLAEALLQRAIKLCAV